MNTEAMRATLRVTKALADPQRVRILMMLEPGELCVCQTVEVAGKNNIKKEERKWTKKRKK